jgi:hypothetical protein
MADESIFGLTNEREFTYYLSSDRFCGFKWNPAVEVGRAIWNEIVNWGTFVYDLNLLIAYR